MAFDPRAFIAGSRWKAASSREYDRPGLRHEYTVMGRTSLSPASHKAMARHIAEHGYRRKFGKWTYSYLEVGEHRYWSMGKIINRCPATATWDDPREAT